jgi:hypothetical protein
MLLKKKGGFSEALERKHHWLARDGMPDYNILTDLAA